MSGSGEEQNGSDQVQDVITVNWYGPQDPSNPLNWSYRRKWVATVITSAFTLMSPISSTIVAPATSAIAEQFGITSSVVKPMATSVFILGYAIGPLFFAPLSELYGRTRVMQGANLFYLVWNTACGLSQSTFQLILFRFLAGLGGGAPFSIGGGVVGDIWRTEERGKAVAVYSLAPVLGPVMGPIVGGWIAQRTTWRWVFWSTSIADALVQILGVMYLQETYAPVLLERKAEEIKRNLTTSAEKGSNPRQVQVRMPYQSKERHWKHVFTNAITRPFRLISLEPIIQLLGLYMAFVYGLLYLTLTTIPPIFKLVYHQSPGTSGLHYIALGVGLTGASQLNARFMDRIYAWLKHRYGEGVGRPEFRLPAIFPSSVLLPCGLLTMGWAAHNGPRVHWIVIDVGLTLLGAGHILNFHSIQSYVIDAYSPSGYAASALAAATFLRSLAGFGFPLFAPAMYAALGYGWGNTLLACVAIVFGCPAPWLIWKYGERIRGRSKHGV